MPHVQAGGARLYYEEAGSGRPVVFVHEFGSDLREWETQLRFFSRSYRCIAYNARGYPPSDVPDDLSLYGWEFAVEDIAAVLRGLSIPRAHVVGLSMGGYAALQFGLRYPEMATAIVMNAKCQRPAVCNAIETLLVDCQLAPAFLPPIARQLRAQHVELRVDDQAAAILKPVLAGAEIKRATEADWFTEYNDYILNVRVVDGVEAAIAHINQYGSAHSDSIVTANAAAAERFLAGVDSATVYWNASTRFTDGGEFGMGAEIGISTDKIGARGPMGLEELTSYKWVGIGNGQIRE